MGLVDRFQEKRKEKYLQRLQARGLQLGRNVYLNDGFFLDPSHCYLITIEDDVKFGPGVKVFAHDASCEKLLGKTKIGLVRIEKGSFVGANAIILPNSVLGRTSILAAGAVLSGHVPAGEVWGGNPARKIMTTSEYRERLLEREADDFPENEYSISVITLNSRLRMIESLSRNGLGYMKGQEPADRD